MRHRARPASCQMISTRVRKRSPYCGCRSQGVLRKYEEDELDQKHIEENNQQRRDHHASCRCSPYACCALIRRIAEKRGDRPNGVSKNCCLERRRVEVRPLKRREGLRDVELKRKPRRCIFGQKTSKQARKIQKERQDRQRHRTRDDAWYYQNVDSVVGKRFDCVHLFGF